MTVVGHHSAEELQALFARNQEREARRAKRTWIVWQARVGQTAPQIAQKIGVSRRTVQEWVGAAVQRRRAGRIRDASGLRT
jgi:transposase